jgi:hypothetical protein
MGKLGTYSVIKLKKPGFWRRKAVFREDSRLGSGKTQLFALESAKVPFLPEFWF